LKADLETRIADSFAATLPSRDIAALLAEVTEADQAAARSSEEANKVALDPATRPDAVAAARKVMEDAQFKRLRMENATAGLQKLKSQAEAREAAEIAAKELALATIERDQLAKDLLEYDELSRKIVVLLDRLRASDARIGRNNSAEIVARGGNFDPWFPDLQLGVRLPSFQRGGGNMGYLWPR